MQTFAPIASPRLTAEVLDYRRLGKQRVETWQILKTLTGQSDGWKNHPAVKMWQGYTVGLAYYGLCMSSEWIGRGYKDTLRERFEPFLSGQRIVLPDWFHDPALNASHRSNLLRKDPVWYGQFDWSEPDDLPYVWPV